MKKNKTDELFRNYDNTFEFVIKEIGPQTEDTYKYILLRFFLDDSAVYFFIHDCDEGNETAMKLTRKDVYKAYLSYQIVLVSKPDPQCLEVERILFETTRDEDSVLMHHNFDKDLSNIILDNGTDLRVFHPLGDGVKWEIQKRYSPVYFDDKDTEPEYPKELYEPLYQFTIIKTYSGEAYRWTFSEEEMLDFSTFLDGLMKYFTEHPKF